LARIWRQRALCAKAIDEQIERAFACALRERQAAALVIKVEAFHFMAGHDGDADALELIVKQIEKRRAIDSDSEQAVVVQIGISDVEDNPAMSFTAQSIDALATFHGDVIEPELVEDSETGWLKEESRSERTSLIEAFENRDAVAITPEQYSSGHSGNSASRDRDVVCFVNRALKSKLAAQSVSWPD
jgi:hypothetical protein